MDYDDDIFDSYAYLTGIVFQEKVVTDYIQLYVAPILLFIGTFGNLFSIVILYKMGNEVMSTCFYLMIMGLVDLIILYTRCGNEWLLKLSSINLSDNFMQYSDALCKVYPFVFNFFLHLSKWLIVAMAVEAYISIRHPKKIVSMCLLERAKAVILLLTVLLVTVNLHYFWSFELVLIETEHHAMRFCTFTKHGHHRSEMFQSIVWPILDMVVAEIIPFLSIGVMTLIMCVQIARGLHNGDEQYKSWQMKYVLSYKDVNQMKIVFMYLILFFFILMFPKCVYNKIIHFNGHNVESLTMKNEAQELLTSTLLTSLEYIFFSCKLFIYLAVSQRFRRELIKLFSFCTCKRHSKIRCSHGSLKSRKDSRCKANFQKLTPENDFENENSVPNSAGSTDVITVV